MRRWFLVALWLAAVPAAAADCDPECDGPTEWSKFTSISLRAIDAGSPALAEWRVQFDLRTQDIRIDMDAPGPSGRMKGTIVLVGGRILMAKGLSLPPGAEISAIDTPILGVKLLNGVLGRALPAGAAAIATERALKHREAKAGIRFATPTTEAHMSAPWTAEGKLTKIANGEVMYDVRITGGTHDPFGRKGPPIDTRFTGRYAMAKTPLIDNAMPLEGWTVYAPGAGELKTVAAVREVLEAALNPGTPDRTKNFTGLWKQDCVQVEGLQIKPAGNDGMYSVSYCTASGCVEPNTYRPNTFITGDRRYKVVNDMEIQVQGQSGFTTYQKCSSNPDPLS